MRICLVGYFVEEPDEGVRNTSKHIYDLLSSEGVEVKKIDIENISCIYDIRKFKPDIIHYLLGPTPIGIISAKLISRVQPQSITIISAIQTSISKYKLWSIFKPDIVLTQSYDSEVIFRSLGCETFFLPSGVDIDKFNPVDKMKKQMLRERYGISSDKFIILHMASFKKERNLDILKKLQKYDDNIQIIIIGRAEEKIDKKVFNGLKDVGCIIWNKYFSNIEEIYSVSDCYIFPTINKRACIETPLSVLEAMSCNLPVITTKFGSLPRMFKEDKGLFFAESDNDFFKAIDMIKNFHPRIDTREKVISYSWDVIIKNLINIYKNCIDNKWNKGI